MEHHGEATGVRLARKHVAWYSKGLPGSAEFRAAVNRCHTSAEVRALIEAFYDPLITRGAVRRLVRETEGDPASERLAA
jgi:tRNA-dihydrouridine synthase B